VATRRTAGRLPPRTGLALGLVLGMGIGILIGRLLELRALGLVLGLLLGVILGLRLDNDRAAEDDVDGSAPTTDQDRGGSDQDGAVLRALLWVVAGLALLVSLAVVTAPELLAAPGTISTVLLVVLAAGLPGVVLLLAVVGRRRRIDREERREDRR
jgi:hypothetical protein